MIIIGVCGDAGIGKTTVSKSLEKYMSVAKIYPFAGPLKEMAREIGWNGEKDEKGRKLLQVLGTEIGRQCISESIWEDKWRAQVGVAARDGVDIMIADDVRFPNELALIRELAGVVIIVRKPSIFRPFKRLFLRCIGRLHASEVGFRNKEGDIIINNAGTMEELDTYIKETVVPEINNIYAKNE